MDFSSVSNEKKEEMVFIAICKLGDTQQMGVARSGFDQKEDLSVVLALPSQDILPRKYGGARTWLSSQLQKFHAHSASLTWACGEAEH